MRAVLVGIGLLVALTEVAFGQDGKQAVAPSFNCATAKSASARLICSDAELSKADAEMGAEYRYAVNDRKDAGEKKTIRDMQLSWIKSRNSRCGLDGKTNAPIEELQSAKPCFLEEYKRQKSMLATAFSGAAAGSAHGVPDNNIAVPPTSPQWLSDIEALIKDSQWSVKCDGYEGDGYLSLARTPLGGERPMKMTVVLASGVDIRIFNDFRVLVLLMNGLYKTARAACERELAAGRTSSASPHFAVGIMATGADRTEFYTLDGKAWTAIQNGLGFAAQRLIANDQQSQQIKRVQEAAQQEANRADSERRETVRRYANEHPVTASGPYSSEVLQCATGIFAKAGVSLPMVKQGACSEYMNLYEVTTTDSRDIPGGIEVMSQITLQVAQPLAGDSFMAQSCYGGTRNNLSPGDKVTVNSRMRFEKWNSGLRCVSTTW